MQFSVKFTPFGVHLELQILELLLLQSTASTAETHYLDDSASEWFRLRPKSIKKLKKLIVSAIIWEFLNFLFQNRILFIYLQMNSSVPNRLKWFTADFESKFSDEARSLQGAPCQWMG